MKSLASILLMLSTDDMMKAEVAEYEIGKRHLANIMGEDPDTFTQDDVDVNSFFLVS